jgi:toxin CcdB
MSGTTVQFDVFVNPIVAARRAYPFVVVLQSDFAATTRDLLAAPLVPRRALTPIAGRLTPIVEIDSMEHVVLVADLAPVRQRDLSTPVGSLVARRADLLDAIDYLFFGV